MRNFEKRTVFATVGGLLLAAAFVATAEAGCMMGDCANLSVNPADGTNADISQGTSITFTCNNLGGDGAGIAFWIDGADTGLGGNNLSGSFYSLTYTFNTSGPHTVLNICHNGNWTNRFDGDYTYNVTGNVAPTFTITAGATPSTLSNETYPNSQTFSIDVTGTSGHSFTVA